MPRSTDGLWESLGLLSGVLQHSEPVLEGSLCKIKISRDGIYLNLLLPYFLEENTGPYSVSAETEYSIGTNIRPEKMSQYTWNIDNLPNYPPTSEAKVPQRSKELVDTPSQVHGSQKNDGSSL